MKDQSQTKQTLIQKGASLDEANEYAENIINTVREPLIVLDQDLRVVTASRSFYEFFKVKPEETAGQLIYDLGNKQWDIPKLRELLENILPPKTTFNDYEVEHDFTTIGRCTMLLNARQIKRALGKERIILLAIEDITDREQADEELKKSKTLLESVFNSSQDLILVIDKDLRVLKSNWKSPLYAGHTEFPINSHCYEAFINRDTPCEPCHALGVFNTGKPILREYYNQYTKLFKEVSVYPIFDDNNHVVMVAEHVRDITERKQAEEALRSEHLMLTRTEGIAHIGSWEWNIATDTVTWSDELFRIFQRDPREGAPSFAEHPAFYHPDDMARLRQAVEAAVADGTPYELELRAIRKDGETRFCVARGVTEMAPGERPIRLFGSLQDITERKQTENILREIKERYGNIFENIVMGISQALPDGRLITANTAYAQMYGYANVEEMMAEVSHVGQRYANPKDREEVLRILKEKGVMEPREMGVVRRNGTRFTVLVSAREIRDSDGNLQYYQAEHIDITEHKLADKALKESEEKYRLLANNIQDVVFAMDMNLNYTYLSPSVKLLRGYEPEEAIKHTPAETATPSSVDLALKILSEMMEIEKSEQRDINISRTAEFEMSRKDGTTVWVETKAFFMRDENQRPVGIMGVTRDITGRKKAEDDLRKSEARYRLISENTADQIAILDMNLHFTYVSPNIIRLRGLTVDEAMGQTLEQVLIPESMKLGMSVFKEEIELEARGTADPNRTRILELEEYKKDGSTIWVEVNFSFMRDKDNKPVEIIMVSRDITERKQAAESLRKSEEKYRTILEEIKEGYFEVDLAGNFTFLNDSLCQFFDSSKEELMGMNYRQYTTDKEQSKELFQAFNRVYSTGEPIDEFDWQIVRRDGTKKYVEASVSLRKDSSGKPIGFRGIARDVTERKRAEDMLRQQTDAMDSAIDGMAILNKDEEYVYLNKAHAKIYGYENEGELIGKSWRVLYDSDVIQRFEQEFMPELSRKGYWLGESIGTKKNKSKFPQEVSLTAMADGGLSCVVRDITERKRVAEALKESENKYRLLADNIQDVIFVLDMNLKYTYVSPSIKTMRGYEPEEVLKQSIEQVLTPSSMDLAIKTISEIMELEKSGFREEISMSRTLQLEMRRKDGTTLWTDVRLSFIRDENKQPIAIMGVTRDITERKQANDVLRESEDRYKNLLNNVPDIIFTIDLEGKITFVSNKTMEILGYENEETINRNIFNFIPEEDHQRALENLQKGMKGEQIKHFQIPMIAKSGERLFFECSFTRVYMNGAVIGAQGTAVNITERKQAEAKLQQTLESLKKAISATIQAMISAIEMRDPYTAGHQLRVADLASTIAMEMGLPSDKIEGIRMAGSIHDIGKLSIPAEILSKPTKLTDIQFSLIKEHSQSGYEMLKDVESPWPLAQIVYQHHERIDGSGYPRNLKGDEILLEARIMAVADVVEAMASHRPYRAALGIDAALEEIEKNKGTHYDNVVADACLKLFREKGYQLK